MEQIYAYRCAVYDSRKVVPSRCEYIYDDYRSLGVDSEQAPLCVQASAVGALAA